MHRMNVISLGLLLLLVCHQAQGQSESDRISDNIKGLIERTEAGWTCERGQPLGNQTAVLVGCHTSSPDRRVASLIKHPRSVAIHIDCLDSVEDSRRIMQSLARKHASEYQQLDGLGDEAYGWGMDKADIVMRKGRFILWIHTNASVEDDPDGRALNLEARSARRRLERLRLAPEFARHLLVAMNSF